jgi:DNA-binding IclR family transcriptional regulator
MNRSVNRSVDIIQLVCSRPEGASLREISQQLGIPRSSAFDIVQTLESRGIIREIPGPPQKYAPGLQLYIAASSYPSSQPLINQSISLLQELAERSGKNTYMGALDADMLVYTYKYKPRSSILTAAGIGERKDLHCTALGKILIAFQSDSERARLVENLALDPHTEHTITDRSRFRQEIKESRERGYAVDRMELDEHTFCIAAPVINAGGIAEMAVSLSYLYDSSVDIESEARGILEVAGQLSSQLQLPGGMYV